MIAPLPWSFSICDIAAASSFSFSSVISHLGGGNWKLGPAEPLTWVLRRESASPLPRDVTKCGVYHSIHLRAIPFFYPARTESCHPEGPTLVGLEGSQPQCCRPRTA